MHYVIGDVHGCYDELTRLLSKIEQSDPDAVILFVGDFIDRGPRVLDVLDWMMTHITADGKYRCVLGNHEDLVLQWWRAVKDSWISDEPYITDNLPALKYGFDSKLREAGRFTREYIEKVICFFESLPLRIDLVIDLPSKRQQFTIAHAYLPVPEQTEDPRRTLIWSREHSRGYHGPEDTILVHGHTPTFVADYCLQQPSTRPAMIAYAGERCINVDTGCCFHYESYGEQFPCQLSAICLETREEFYSSSVNPYS